MLKLTVSVSTFLCINVLRIALCIDGPKRFAANARQLLGKEAIKQRHPRILGSVVVQVSADLRSSDVYLVHPSRRDTHNYSSIGHKIQNCLLTECF